MNIGHGILNRKFLIGAQSAATNCVVFRTKKLKNAQFEAIGWNKNQYILYKQIGIYLAREFPQINCTNVLFFTFQLV